MVDLAKHRLEAYAGRAQVVLSDVAVHFPFPDHLVDCIVSSYVLDLLSEADIRHFLSEAHRTLTPGGRVASLALLGALAFHRELYRLYGRQVPPCVPTIVGGCRPIDLASFIDERQWRIMHRRVLTPFGVPSEVLILEMLGK